MRAASPALLLFLVVNGSPTSCADDSPGSEAHRHLLSGNSAQFAEELLAHSQTGWVVHRSTVSGGTEVVTISEFFPPSLALAWHAALNSTWRRTEGCRKRGDCSPGNDGDGCSWLYTTNSHGGNAKIRSVFRQSERRAEVGTLYKRGAFAYSKWELTSSHPLHHAMGEIMETADVKQAIARAMWPNHGPSTGRGLGAADEALGEVSDYFVTAYDDGDFLSTHSDGASGSLAWVIHLTGHGGGWSSTSGGALRFNQGRVIKTPQDFEPGFNKLHLFLTRPSSCPHQVLPVSHSQAGAEPRFGITGWYMTKGDHFDANTKREHELMRAAATKASKSDQCF